jgi:hypothetical protein
MISSYLSLLYTNCILFIKTEDCNEEVLTSFFKVELQNVLSACNLKTEDELITFLISKPYPELEHVFEKSKFIHIFYLVNSINEYAKNINTCDNLGRFKFSESIIKESGIENNTVLQLMKSTINDHLILKQFFKINNHKSYFYLSHDIDSVYGSLTQDGLWAIKKGRMDVLMKLFFNLITSRPHWLNFDLIMNIESEYDFKSTFYWLVNKGKIDKRQTNADYSISSPAIINSINLVNNNKFENGLHKSISDETFKSEISKMPISVVGNRYHYLKFSLPDAYDKIEEAELSLDASLGFAEHYGFRNGYAYPFHPYNVAKNKPYSFLEVPLNIMDGTFQRYMQIPVEKTAEVIISFLEKHNENALLSILWHNTFFSNYKYNGYLNEYKKILSYLYESKFQNINQNEIIDKFSWKSK